MARPHTLAALHTHSPEEGPNQEKRRPWGTSGQWDYSQKSPSRCKPLWGSSAETKVKSPEAQITRQSDGQPWRGPACKSCPRASQVRRWRQRPHAPLIQGSLHKVINMLGRPERMFQFCFLHLRRTCYFPTLSPINLPSGASSSQVLLWGLAPEFMPRSAPPKCCPLPRLPSL